MFSATADDGSVVTYVDKKRWLWVFGSAWTAFIPYLAIGAYFATGGAVWTALIVPVHLFVVIPAMDKLFGEDPHNPPEAVAEHMAADPFYSRVVYALVPMPYFVFIGTVWFVVTQGLPFWADAALLIGVGLGNGQCLILAHELGHRTGRFDRLMAKIALGTVGYGHFCAEHNRGHHMRVATPEDCASARMGESIYGFALRELPGALKGGWEIEAARLRKRGLRVWGPHNEILQADAITLLLAAALIAWLGLAALPVIVIHHALGWFALTLVNYIEHYGLLRQKRPDGRYEPVQPRHSWNTNHIFSNLLEIHLQRHSDHHAHPMRPYQALRDFEGIPRLPSGYPGCFGMALLPPVWFRVMDPRVMAWAEGDLSRANVQPSARARLAHRWDRTAEPRAA